jgi:hypothetical protein
MLEADSDQQALNPAEPGDIPADSPPAVPTETPEQSAETSNGDDSAESRAEKPKGGFQRRISELTRAQRELREELARERAEREALQSKLNPVSTEKEPQRDQFDDWDSYERARVRYEARQAFREESQAREAEMQQRAMQQQAAQVHTQWESRLDAAREQFDDLDEYVDVVGERLNPVLAEVIKAAELGPQIVRHLGQNPKDLDRITNLPGIQAVYELARLETRLNTRPKASNAPTPANPVKTTAAPANALRDDLDMKAWMDRRRTELRR